MARPLAGFTVAVSHRSKHNGEWQDVTEGFFRCTAWRSNAENAARTLKKGMRVFVVGKLVQRTWQDDAGNKRHSVEIQVTPGLPWASFVDGEEGGSVNGEGVLGVMRGGPRLR